MVIDKRTGRDGRCLGGQIMAVRQRQNAVDQYMKNPNRCKYCGQVILVGKQKVSTIKQKIFCNHSCSSKYTNRARVKREVVRCIKCGCKIDYRNGRKLCRCCYIENVSLLNKVKSESNERLIHLHAQRVMEQNKVPKVCKFCPYDKYVEIHHIKSLKEFADNTPIRQINDPCNLIYVCPNCHTEIHLSMRRL